MRSSGVTYGDEIAFTTLPDDAKMLLPEGALPGLFSVAEGRQVRFSKGNLQYQASTGIWRFAERHTEAGELNFDLGLGEDKVGVNEGATLANEPDEVDTKLDLARAYDEMGDKEGARELIEEVIREGNPQQQEKARQLQAQLDS